MARRVTIRNAMRRIATTFTLLMGKGEAARRRQWMERDGNSVEADL